MSEPFVGEIKIFAGNFAPRGYALCDGQLLAISQNGALFSLLGTFYGGDGRTTFGLPEMRGRVPLHLGTGPGLSPRPIGQRAGGETVSLTANQVAAHSHAPQGSSDFAGDTSPANNVPATGAGTNLYQTAPATTAPMDPEAVVAGGGSSNPHANVMPFLCINFIIALVGFFPSRS